MTPFGHARAALRGLVFLAWTLPLIPIQTVAVYFRWPLAKLIQRVYHQVNCKILGFEVVWHGSPARERPILFVSNHSSYLDIIVMASHLDASFIAKAEVAGWPLFGVLAKLNRSVFVERRAMRSGGQRDEMQRRLESGDNLILFPEGTSNDGNRVYRFSSTFFGVAERQVDGRPLTVQPMSIAYTDLNGLPMGRGARPLFAWYGGMDLMSHLWSVLGQGRATVQVILHAPVTIDGFASRKEMARVCHEVVADGVSQLLCGRAVAPPPAPVAAHGAA